MVGDVVSHECYYSITIRPAAAFPLTPAEISTFNNWIVGNNSTIGYISCLEEPNGPSSLHIQAMWCRRQSRAKSYSDSIVTSLERILPRPDSQCRDSRGKQRMIVCNKIKTKDLSHAVGYSLKEQDDLTDVKSSYEVCEMQGMKDRWLKFRRDNPLPCKKLEYVLCSRLWPQVFLKFMNDEVADYDTVVDIFEKMIRASYVVFQFCTHKERGRILQCRLGLAYAREHKPIDGRDVCCDEEILNLAQDLAGKYTPDIKSRLAFILPPPLSPMK